MYCCTSAPVHSDRGLDGPRVGSSRSKCVVTTPGAKGPRTPEPDALTAEACTEFWRETKRAASQSLSKSSYLSAGRLGRPHARAVRHLIDRRARDLLLASGDRGRAPSEAGSSADRSGSASEAGEGASSLVEWQEASLRRSVPLCARRCLSAPEPSLLHDSGVASLGLHSHGLGRRLLAGPPAPATDGGPPRLGPLDSRDAPRSSRSTELGVPISEHGHSASAAELPVPRP